MNTNFIDFSEQAQDARRALERERDRLTERLEQMDGFLKMMDATDELLSEIEDLKADNDWLREQLAEEKKLRAEQEMKMTEMSKLSAGMAKKASQDDLLKALRIYLNSSKRKSPSKREAAKMVFTELFTSAKLDLPDDIMEMLAHLDDEQAESPAVTTVNVAAGGINVQQANYVRK